VGLEKACEEQNGLEQAYFVIWGWSLGRGASGVFDGGCCGIEGAERHFSSGILGNEFDAFFG
jgi:hypothetical protein